MKHKIIHTRQTAENECGLCCISILASFYGYIQPLSYYRNKYNVGRDGLSLYNINMILQDIGLQCEAYEVKNILDFYNQYKTSNPILAHINNNHYVVIVLKKKYLKVFDPIKEPYKMCYEDFNKQFSGYLITTSTNSTFSSTKKANSEFRHFTSLIKKILPTLMIVLIASMLSYLISIIVPLIMQSTINLLTESNEINFLKVLIQISMIVLIFCLISYFRNKGFIKLQTCLYRVISVETIQHLFRIKYSFFDNRSQGNILYRLNFLTQIQSIISNELLNLILSFTSIIVICSYFIFEYPRIFPFILVIVIVIFLGVGLFNKKIMVKKRKEILGKEKVENTVTEIVNNMFQIKCLHLDRFFLENYSLNFLNYEKEFISSQSSIQTLSTIISAIFTYLPIYCIIVILAISKDGNYTFGELFALYSFFTTLFTQCFTFINGVSTFLMLKVSLFYFNDLLDEPEIIENNDEKLIKINFFDSLEIRNLCFRYDNFNKNVLNNINLELKKGEKVAVVGLSGSGKTTLIKVLSNLYLPTSGTILINGIDVSDIDMNSIVNKFSFVPQSPVFFNKSIRSNITLDDDSITDETVINVLKLANIWDEIKLMPMGLDTIVSGQGGNMSGGQIQRLSLARALINNPKVLIMDEATSSLDVWNEKIIYSNLKKAKISQLIISHRLSTVKDADRIYVLCKGNIGERGTHEELMKMKGLYYNLFKNQL
ncbi:peptidase domain-containing ABC transporter [Thomasclavelia spiroformis]|uniref:peptidase domain-containing ABC transporter n=1 Tax=Thomasclavelia spiroformis TaxID=29348 RepID=UPI0024202DAB|nr:peptidase domain-containing ABC transporter [Thomasclavelia spiroformis]MBS6114263.1 peptidase domain-containing ABC transporter [Thomasclavelia spiroformis]